MVVVWIWVALATVSAYWTLFNWLDAREIVLSFTRRGISNGRMTLGKAFRRQSGMLLLAQISFLLAGLAALFIGPVEVRTRTETVLLILSTLLIDLSIFHARRERYRVMRINEEEEVRRELSNR